MDWFEPSYVGIDAEDVARVLLSYVPGSFEPTPTGGRGYAEQWRGPAGSQILFDERRPEVHVVLPGEWCAALDESGMRGLLAWSRARVCNVSRLDLCGDDTRRRVTPADVRWAVVEGHQLVTHTQRRSFTESMTSLHPGTTATFGARGSRHFLRVYDKTAESNGAIDAIRWELEARDEAAMALLQVLPSVKGWGQIWADAVSSFVDFRERHQRANVSDCDRVAWFDELLGDVEKWSPYPARAPRTVDVVFDWLCRCIGPSLALVLFAADGDVSVLTEVAAAGKDRLRPSHRLMLAQYRAGEAVA